MPGTENLSLRHSAIVERAETVRAFGRMHDELPLEFDDSERTARELDHQGQS
jgi:hypothetical protein